MKNRKLITEAVNEIQLDDLYTAASKLEQQVTSLAEMAVKFSNINVKKQAIALKSQANGFAKLLSDILMGEEEENVLNVEKDVNKIENVEGGEEVEVLESAGVNLEPSPEVKLSLHETFNNIYENELLDIEDDEEQDGEENDEDIETEVEEETFNGIDLSPVFSKIISNLTPELIEELKDALKDSIANIEGEEAIENIKSEIDNASTTEDLDSILDEIYNYAEQNDIEFKV